MRGRPTTWKIIEQGPVMVVVGFGWGLFTYFALASQFSRSGRRLAVD